MKPVLKDLKKMRSFSNELLCLFIYFIRKNEEKSIEKRLNIRL